MKNKFCTLLNFNSALPKVNYMLNLSQDNCTLSIIMIYYTDMIHCTAGYHSSTLQHLTVITPFLSGKIIISKVSIFRSVDYISV